MKYKHLLFDFDDTIYDTHKNAEEALREVYEHFSLKDIYPDYLEFSNVYWKKNHEVWDLYSRNLIKREELIVERFLYPLRVKNTGTEKEALEMSDFFLDSTSKKKNLIEGALELLKYLYPLYPMHILSNGFTEVQYKKIKSGGVDRFFSKIILSEQIGINKPDKRFFEYALSQIGVTASQTIMIGDNYNTDIIGAINSGIDQIYYNPNSLIVEGNEPTFQVKKLSEIPKLLEV
ncbi:MAG: YjjG family noncanonical pyrimidine nucleotidase [Bacteroidales bacterium]|nr:YjjG family noncanonical pyrimidine nucleotidase [Bacteroidales bacterium]